MLLEFIVKYHNFLLLPTAFVLDAIFGDPEWFPHPVRFIGKLISFLDKNLYSAKDSHRLAFVKGAFLFFAVFLASGITVFVLHSFAWKLNPIAGFAFDSFIACTCIAPHDLCRQSGKVAKELKAKNLSGARIAVSRIVGRDVDRLDEEDVIRATIETVAESTNDGIVAPSFYLFLLGPVGGILYKAVNTLDSMVGYKNARYEYFGKFAARADDIAGFIPARFSAFCVILATDILRLDSHAALKIFLRDRYKHPSPNSAQTESAFAGALNVRLAGPAWYAGVLEEKPTLGDSKRQPSPQDISRANRLMYVSSILACAILTFGKALIF